MIPVKTKPLLLGGNKQQKRKGKTGDGEILEPKQTETILQLCLCHPNWNCDWLCIFHLPNPWLPETVHSLLPQILQSHKSILLLHFESALLENQNLSLSSQTCFLIRHLLVLEVDLLLGRLDLCSIDQIRQSSHQHWACQSDTEHNHPFEEQEEVGDSSVLWGCRVLLVSESLESPHLMSLLLLLVLMHFQNTFLPCEVSQSAVPSQSISAFAFVWSLSKLLLLVCSLHHESAVVCFLFFWLLLFWFFVVVALLVNKQKQKHTMSPKTKITNKNTQTWLK